MTDSNKVVLKINYQGQNIRTDKTKQTKVVTEWNIKRILIALVFVILFIVLLLALFSNRAVDSNDEQLIAVKKESEPTEGAIKPITENTILTTVEKNVGDNEKQKRDAISPKNIQSSQLAINESTEIDNTDPIVKPVENNKKKYIDSNQAIAEPVSNPPTKGRLSRALLSSGVNNREPVDNIGNTIEVDDNGVSKAYYFTELINMKGQILYHHWLWKGQTLFKRKMKIRGNRWRASTSKRILYSQTGEWNVRLVDEEGIILNNIKFDVIKSNSNSSKTP